MYGGHSSATAFALNPMIGIFPANNLAIILNTSYGSYSSTFSTSSLLIGPLVRYYIPASQSVKFFGGAGIEWASGDGEAHTVYQFQAGPSFFINRNLALEFNFSYQWTTINSSYENISSTEKQSQFGTSVGFLVYLGKSKAK
jgi:hypothetical protein